jgi:hypothetical protein
MTTPANNGTGGNAAPVAPQPGTPAYNALMAERYEQAQQGTKPDANAQNFQAPTQEPVKVERPAYIPEKFWDAEKGEVRTEAMAKSYVELEKTKGQPAKADDKAQPQQDGGDIDPETAVSNAGLDWNDVTSTLQTTGDLKPEHYEALKKSGIPEEVVRDYVQGQRVVQEMRFERTAEYVAQQSGRDGNEMLEKMLAWASSGGLGKAQTDAVNTLLAGEDTWKQGIDTLANSFIKANPMYGEGNQISGNGGGTSGTVAYTTKQEMVAAMSDPRYKSDPVYRASVRSRVAISPF